MGKTMFLLLLAYVITLTKERRTSRFLSRVYAIGDNIEGSLCSEGASFEVFDMKRIDFYPNVSSEIVDLCSQKKYSLFLSGNGEVFSSGSEKYNGLGGISTKVPQLVDTDFFVSSLHCSVEFSILCSSDFDECYGFGDNSDWMFLGFSAGKEIFNEPQSLHYWMNRDGLDTPNITFCDLIVGIENTAFLARKNESSDIVDRVFATGKDIAFGYNETYGYGWQEIFNLYSNQTSIKIVSFLYKYIYLLTEDNRWFYRGVSTNAFCSGATNSYFFVEFHLDKCNISGFSNELAGKNVSDMKCSSRVCVALTDTNSIYIWATVDIGLMPNSIIPVELNMINASGLSLSKFQVRPNAFMGIFYDAAEKRSKIFGFSTGINSMFPYGQLSFVEFYTMYNLTENLIVSKGLDDFALMLVDTVECWGKYSNDSTKCVNGVCYEKDFCECDENYGGEYCGVEMCFGFLATSSLVCNGNGQCTSPGKCTCTFKPVVSSNCTIPSCYGHPGNDPEVCSSHGDCINYDACQCDKGFIGEKCNEHADKTKNVLAIMIPVIFVSLVCVILFLCCVALIIFALCGMLLMPCFTSNLRNKKSLSKFQSLRNFDLLLEQQHLVEEGYIANVSIDKDIFNLDIDEIHLLSVLGSGGSYSKVYKAKYQGEIYAFKSFDSTTVFDSQQIFEEFQREVSILGSFRHKNILSFYGACIKAPRIGILMEYCSNGDLKHFLKKYKSENDDMSYPTPEKLRIIKEIASAIAVLHSKAIIHRDIKLENVLVDDNEISKLMDFGLSRNMEDQNRSLTKGVGTNLYMSPEVIRGEEYSESVDTYSFGILCWIVLTEIHKCYGKATEGIEYKVANNPFFRPSLKEIVGLSWMKKVIKSCWDHDPEKRPSFDSIVKMFEKKEDDSIVIYYVFTESFEKIEEEDAEDHLLKEKTIKGLEEILENSSKKEKYRIFVEKEKNFIRLRSDEDVRKYVEEDCFIIFQIKRDEKEKNIQLSLSNKALVKELKDLEKQNRKLDEEISKLKFEAQKSIDLEKRLESLSKENKELKKKLK